MDARAILERSRAAGIHNQRIVNELERVGREYANRERLAAAPPDVKEPDPREFKTYAEMHKADVVYRKTQHDMRLGNEHKAIAAKRRKEMGKKKPAPGVSRGGVRKNKKKHRQTTRK